MAGLASELSGPQMCEFFNRFGRFGGDYSMVQKLLGHDELMQCAIDAINERLNRNSHEITVEETLARFRNQNTLGNWGYSEEVFTRLASTAPSWPKGRDAFRSLRIRFGEGDQGVAFTFERHAEAVKRVFGDKYWRWELLLSGKAPHQNKDVERLRLLNGNATHKPVVEWIIVNDLSANRERTDITSVRGGASLADEGLVLAWLFPDQVHAIDYKQLPAWFCAGYELNVPERDVGEWRYVVVVHRDVGAGEVYLGAYWRDDGDSGYSVPSLGSAT